MFRITKNLQSVTVIGIIIAITAVICVGAATCYGSTLTFNSTYFFIYFRQSDNAISASALSQTASSYGGAGYILCSGEQYYIILSCYYDENLANSVLANLKKNGVDCSILKKTTDKYPLLGNAKNNKKLYIGNLNTLNSLSRLAYNCANELDTGKCNQSGGKEILSTITNSLKELLKSNQSNCFSQALQNVLRECESASYGYLLSKNMRYVQIAIIDAIINVKLN